MTVMRSLYYLVHLSVLLYQLQSIERQRFNLCRSGMFYPLELQRSHTGQWVASV